MLDWTPNTNHSGIYLARAKGWYRAAGLDVKIIEPGDAGVARSSSAAGKADVAFSAAGGARPGARRRACRSWPSAR